MVTHLAKDLWSRMLVEEYCGHCIMAECLLPGDLQCMGAAQPPSSMPCSWYRCEGLPREKSILKTVCGA